MIISPRMRTLSMLMSALLLFVFIMLVCLLFSEQEKTIKALDLKVNEVNTKQMQDRIVIDQLVATPTPTLKVVKKK